MKHDPTTYIIKDQTYNVEYQQTSYIKHEETTLKINLIHYEGSQEESIPKSTTTNVVIGVVVAVVAIAVATGIIIISNKKMKHDEESKEVKLIDEISYL